MEIEKLLPGVQKNISLKNYTTFKIGGKARYFLIAKTKEDLIKAIKIAKKFKMPFFILGGGSKILVSDKGFKGLIIKMKNENAKCKIICEAGMMLSKLINLSMEKKLSGLEWAAGIPGTIGGAVSGNAEAFGESIGDIVKGVEVFNFKNQKIEILKNKDCQFKYRESIFKKKKNLIILSAELEMKETNKKKIKDKIKTCFNVRKRKQPLEYASAGSVFKNPKGFFAGFLIEKCGLKGKRVGNAEISKKHANFIVNLGKAKAEDVKKLINLAKKQVRKKFGVVLEEEIQYLGF